MTKHVDWRSCHRFHVPEANIRYKKGGMFGPFRNFSERSYPVKDISKGGLSFECTKRIAHGRKLALLLFTPDEDPIRLNCKVKWHSERGGGKKHHIAGVSFRPFGANNPVESLEALRRLEKKYVKEGPKE